MLWATLLTCQCLLIAAEGPGPGRRRSLPFGAATQMQSRAVDTRVQLEVQEGQSRGTLVGSIPTRKGFTYRFNEPPTEFALDAVTGAIKTTMVLDRESFRSDRFDLVVLSSQPTYPIEVRIVVTDVNDNAPEFPEPSISVTFSESSATGTRLLLDSAFDRDTGPNGVSEDYRIVDGNKDDKFRLVVTTNPSGDTSYLHLETTGKLDRETRGFYVLNISARDGGTTPLIGFLQVNVTVLDVNDNPPMFDHSDYNVSLNESVVPGTSVLQVMATDNDIGDNARVTYYLEDLSHQFAIDPETGIITTTEPLSCVQQQNCSEPLPYGSCPRSCVISVTAWDHGNPRQVGRAYVTVNLIQVNTNDHDPIINFTYFLRPAKFATVDENAMNGSVVAAVTVVDLDEGLNGETDVIIKAGNEMNHFRLDSTPAVRVNGALDREEISKYNLTIVATDRGNPSRSSSASLIIYVNDVNDHEPVFEKSEYSAVLSELSPPGTYVAGTTASDADSGVNAQIYYAFVSGNERNWFEMKADSGLITTRSTIDREVQGSVELKISARDGGPNTKWAYTHLKVTILDENDEAPKFSQEIINVTLSENALPNSMIAMLTASDPDQGTNGSVAYYLVPDAQQKHEETFSLDSLTGQLTTKTRLDRETISHYDIRVVARDQGVPPQSSTALVHLTVEDVNDNSPVFYPTKYFSAIREDYPKGNFVLQVFAYDLDEGKNAELRYSITRGGDGLFHIDERTGMISLSSSLLSSAKSMFRLTIGVKDMGGRTCDEDAVVEFVKDNVVQDLEFEPYNGYEFKVVEDHADKEPSISTEVGRVQVRAGEYRGNKEDLQYFIVLGDPTKRFNIDPHSGLITTANRIDRETTQTYSLTCIARANLSYGKTIVNITVIDLNDNKPLFDVEKDLVTFPENSPVGQEVYHARVVDYDAGDNRRVRYSLSVNTDDLFRINEGTGVVYLRKPIQREAGTILNLQITAADYGEPSLSSQQKVSISIQDVNDHTPVFDHTSYETSLLESTPVNNRFFRLAASDADLDKNGLISYSIVEGNSEGKFGVFPDGYLYVKTQLDRETKDYYSLVLMAADHGEPQRSSTVPLVVHVIDENDNSPQFTNSTFTFHVSENEPPDSFVGKLTALDSDIGRNAELTFQFSTAQKDFVIDPKNGFIKTLNMFDREALVEKTGKNVISLEAVVNDNGMIRLKDKVMVFVYVDDENDNHPVFLKTPYKVQVSEGSGVETQVLKVYTSDADDGINGDVFYSITAGNEGKKFAIDAASGQISLLREPDREEKSHYVLTVTAYDGALTNPLSSTAVVVIDVLDENDNAPMFSQSEARVSVIETAPMGTKLTQFQAIDSDLGVNSEVTFSIESGNRRETFQMDPTTGNIFLHKALDYEELNSYTLAIVASDGGNPRLSSTSLLTVVVEDSNDNPPAFPNTAIVRQIREGISINTPIVTVTAEDPDSGDNGMVRYSITNQEPENPQHDRHFGINPVTGVIHTLLPIDREVVDTFRLTITATDQAASPFQRLSAEKLVTVIVEDINDNAPSFVSMNAAVLPPNARDGPLIMHVFARDLDSNTNGLVTYELVGGSTELFKLHRSTGALSLRRGLQDPAPTYRLVVKATDEAVQSERKSSETYITLVAPGEPPMPTFVRSGLSGSVYENEPPGTSVLSVSAAMPGTTLEYVVTNVTGDGVQVDRFFDVDETGVLSTSVALDREAGHIEYEVEIYAVSTNSTRPHIASIKVRVSVLDKNDSPPSFRDTQLEFSISEDLPPGSVVGTIRASDPDTLGQISYQLLSGGDGRFVLEPGTGVLRLNDSLDRETHDHYRLLVRAHDGVQYSDALVKLTVTDTNDNPPAFSEPVYSFDIAENTPRGARVGEVSARDDDQGVNGQVTYQVVSDWANDVFSLNLQSGVFTLTSRLDYEDVQHYIFVVQAQDMGKPSLSSTLTVYVNVLDLNDNAPLFDPMSYSDEVFENVTVGTSVVTVSATDMDAGANGLIEYGITSGDDDGMFSIAENGSIVTMKALDRETKSLYNLVVTATDMAAPPQPRLSSTVQVTIVLKDVNDKSAEFLTPNETSVMENIPPNTVVLAVKAIDRDEGRNSYLEYSLSGAGPFSLGPVDGLLRVTGRLDRETKSSYTLEVTARDRGDPPRSSKQTILLTVLDENDNSPVFDPKQYSASVPENASIGARVLQVSATDVDEGSNGRVRYSIVAGDENRDFSISEDSGVVRVAKNLNFERKSRYVLSVRAEDSAVNTMPRYDTATISIAVADINDNPPTFLDSPYLALVMENVIPPGGFVLTVRAYDADTPPYNGQVRYFLKEGDAGLFRINASTGVISLLKPLDREAQAEYLLTLHAMDTGAPPLTGTGTVRIIVEDVNDHSPVFTRQSYSAFISEGSPVGSPVVQPTATDLDEGLNAKIRYSLLGDGADVFKIDEKTGLITLSALLDRESNPAYFLSVVAQDCSDTEPHATAVNLTVTVLDENDNVPQFGSSRYTVYIPDRTKAGQFVFGAKAFDLDSGPNSQITYSLRGPDAARFSMSAQTGVIAAASELTMEGTTDQIYRLEIEAKDGGMEPLSTSVELTVKLWQGNMFPVINAPIERHFTLPENANGGRVITSLRATSPKAGAAGKVRFAIAGGNIGEALGIDQTSGDVIVTGRGFDFEMAPTYEVWVEAKDSDNPPLRTVLQLIINVTDANDNPPKMDQSLFNATILEEEYPPQTVCIVTATDADSEQNGKVSFRLVDDVDGTFSIDEQTGEISTEMKLDRETTPTYNLVVLAIDHGNPQLTGTATVSINVLDKNDNYPKFTRLFSVNVTENAEPGTFVIRVTSSDQDVGENANATYSFTENPGEKFAIHPITGNVTVAGSLDRELQDEYLLKVEAFDGSWKAETPLTITIQDQNDNAPEFEHSYHNFNFPELQSSVVFVGQVTATDRDKHGPNSVISYSLKHPSDLFTVDPASGELFSKRTLRYKYTAMGHSPENQYSLTVLATDNGKPPMSSECLVTINVVDANNSPPKFTHSEYSGPVPATARVGLKILHVEAIDSSDYGVNAEIEYSIVGGNGSDLFKINKDNGWVTLTKSIANSRLLERFVLQVRAIDKGAPPQSDQSTVVVIVTGDNLYPPVFSVLSSQVIIPENDPVGSVILTVAATDNDDGPNGQITYSISGSNEENMFGINRKTGALTILKPLDYDDVPEYHLNITATDKGFESRSATAFITIALTDVNDNPPVFNQSAYKAYIPENSPPLTAVFRIEAKDVDSPKNAIIEYSIIRGSGKDLFSIDSVTGLISSIVRLDYEERNQYSLEVIAVNPGSTMSATAKLTIFVTGVNEFYPKFVRPVFHFDVSESSDVGTSVGAVLATDADGGDDGKVAYLLVGSSNDKGFSISHDSGVISVARRLDRETQSRIVLTVLAKNAGSIRGNDTDEAQVVISVQDGNDPPEFSQSFYQASVLESAQPGTKILTVSATDTDVRPQNNQFSYSIISGDIDKAFKIDPLTGEIETTALLDREKIASYTLSVGAIDVGVPPQTGTATVKILVGDVNDNGPMFDAANLVGYVTENEPPNTNIMTLAATDPDLPLNGAPFSYYLVGGRHKKLVKIEKETGVVRTTKIIDREANPELDIMVEVEDNGSPRMKSQYNLKITVLDQNDSPSSPRTVEVLVHYVAGTSLPEKIADVHPNDADTSGDYQCKLIHSMPTGALRIRHGCELSTVSVSPGIRYSLTVSGNDGRHADVTSKIFVEFFTFDNTTIENSFTLRIENMTSPRFLSNYYKSFLESMRRNSELGASVQILSMNEVDSGLELTMAVKRNIAYANKGTSVEKLSKSKEALQQMFDSVITIGYSPCQKSVCENGGGCSDGIRVTDETRITDSQNIVFTSPVVSHDFTCRCPDGFTGKRCERRHDPCQPNPCQAGGVCRRQGYDFTCTCPAAREGKFCELERGNVCDGSHCRNGGSCQPSPDGASFFCLCRPGYRGNHCETAADSCRPNPCLHGGLCVSLKPGYRCSCPEARYGRHCEKATYGFGELSFMTFPPLDVTTNDITITFATTKPDSLLLYNYGGQTGGRSDFVALELVGGKAVFAYGGARSAITSVTVPRGNISLATGEWHKLTATRNGRVMSLSVASCTENGDICRECRAGDSSCFTDDIGPTGTLNFNNQPVLVGGLATSDPVLERPGQVHSDDFVGCIHSIWINGRTLNLSSPLRSRNVSPTCGRARSPCAADADVAPCGTGRCLDRWRTHHCLCGPLLAKNCGDALQPVTLTDGAFLEFKISEKHSRMQLLDNLYHGSTEWTRRGRTRRFVAPTTPAHSPPKSLSLMFRTVKKDGLLFYATTNRHFTSVELMDGHLVYSSHVGVNGPTVNMSISDVAVVDGAWHNMTLHSQNRGLRLLVDGQRVGDELDSAGVHDFLDAYLTSLYLGGVRKEVFHSPDTMPKGFEGCISNFTINNEVQSLNGSGSILSEVIAVGSVTHGCSGPVGIGATTAPDPLSIGVTLVIVFFVTLLVAILVSFVVFHLRRQKKEKGGAPVGRGGKQSGGATLVAGGGGLVGGSDVLSRGLHGEANVGYLSEGGDVIRGHHLVAPELISKKYKEREIHSPETTRPPRPDIIEREVVSKSPLRDEHHPPPPPTDDIPEHYDLENASSIAPSDIDIVYHYKGYREGGIRKYKATPPHIPASTYHHKHGGGTPQHRHTAPVLPPPSRDSPRSLVPPPPSSSSQPSNKCTPLARLSPSSELSSQQPRILTLSDISGKPLQSALLATTSSSGGVGKDVLHSNSERSLNSPVMSQLSGQSSSASRKNPTPGDGSAGKGTVPMGLTTEEIERFNCRSSSLVSTLDAVSSSSEARRQNANNIPDNNSSTSTDESGNDSFTCSEIEYDNNSITGCKMTDSTAITSKSPVSPAYDGFDSSFRGSLSTLVASDDDLSTHMGGLLYRPPNGSPSSAAALGWDYLLNWGPNFESLVGVFKDIAELPDAVNGRVQSLRLPSQSPKPSEEYV